ncbi:DoxX family protein [Tateyamaria sp.]|uniref:DoxX family protein n=1 Tax=Tateyamaria sp. TaxID=1929288 RepID=UPI00329BCF0B
MTALTRLQAALFAPFDRDDWLLPTVARIVFLAVFFFYFNNSFGTKISNFEIPLLSIKVPLALTPDASSVFVQMFPKAFEAAGYDETAMPPIYWGLAVIGTWAEFLLPVFLILGLFTRLSAIGMIGFVLVQTFTDVVGHSIALGSLFNNLPELVDTRMLWIFLLLVLAIKGAGPFSIDRIFTPRTHS